MNPPERSDMPVLEFVADALFGIGCMIVGLGGLCTLATWASAPASLARLAGWRPLGVTLVIGGAVMLLGRGLRRVVRAQAGDGR